MGSKEAIGCYFFGSCKSNPGGEMIINTCAITRDGEVLYGNSGFYEPNPGNTNIVADYLAFIDMIDWVNESGHKGPFTLLGSVRAVINQMNGENAIKSGAYVEKALEAKEIVDSMRSAGVDFEIKWIHKYKNICRQ